MRLAPVLILVCVAGCSMQQDEPVDAGTASYTVADIQNPNSAEYHPCANTAKVCNNQTVGSAVVTLLDKFDETADGKSAGTLYIRDLGPPHAYGGIGVYEPNFVPANLDPLPGDVIDFAGPYQEASSIGKAIFNAHTFLPQLYKPVGTFRFEFASDFPATWSEPMVLNLADLNENTLKNGSATPDGNFGHARQFLQMLVTVNDVQVGPGSYVAAGSGGRVTYPMYPAGGTYQQSVTPPALSNELFDLKAMDYPAGTRFKSVTGIVTWFFSFHIAPRSRDDLVPYASDAGAD